MSDIVSAPSTHADLRGASRSYNRDKSHQAKWTFGARTAGQTNLTQPILDSAWTANATPTTSAKTVPEKWNGRLSGLTGSSKSHANVSTKARGLSHHNIESANLRVTRKQDALREITSPDSKQLSRSLADLLPSPNIPIQNNVPADADILYSFDKKASPSDKVGLGGLIEKAEQRWREKETVKLVRSEYEVLDGEGEREVLKKGKRASPVVRGVGLGTGGLGDDEDYELV